MKRRSLLIGSALTCALIAALTLSSCAPTSIPEEYILETLEPATLPAIDLEQIMTVMPSTWLGQLCPENGPLPEDDPEYQVRFEAPFQEGEFWFRAGVYTNKLGQTFNYTVKGVNDIAVMEYTDALRVCMELLPPAEMGFETDVTDEATVDERSEDEVFRESNDALVIYSNPSDENAEAFGDGYIWVFLIDPGIGNGVPHDYTRFCRDGVRTTVTVSAAGGSVRATHYRQPPGGLNAASTRNLFAGGQTTWNYIGRATYDLAVTGTSPGVTRYSVSGTIWNFGFYSLPPFGGGSRCQ